jgi:hypothetical protein
VEESPNACPIIGEEATCVWPSALQLDLDESGGRFRMQVTLDRRMVVPLPGSSAVWPLEVTVTGNTAAVVLAHEATPSVTLPAGTFEVRGLFRWNELPETLTIPARLALLEVRVGGKPVLKPRRDQNRLWLKADPTLESEPESLGLVVFRHLQDGVPFQIDTRLLLTVSGRAREVLLGSVLLPGSVPLALEAEVPVRIEQGLVYAQVFPGKHQIRFASLLPTPPDTLSRPKTDSVAAAIPFWPKREVWVFTPNSQVRQVELGGAPGIDPAQTELPSEWKQLAAYSVEPGGGLTLETRRRGEPDAPPNRVDLRREMWLDLDGGGYTVRDQFGGTMNRDWRLDLERGNLGRVAVAGVDQLITKNTATGRPGVELREGALQVIAEWRGDQPFRELPAVGWSQDVQTLETRVHVPPGWRILSASGVDSMSETWLATWDLFALFFVLVVALSIAKLANPGWGLLALVTLVASHGEAGAPFATWLCLVVGIALCRVVPKSWFRQAIVLYTAGAAVAVTLTVVSFGVGQVRAALYPQVEMSDDWLGGEMVPAAPEAAYDNMEGGTGMRASSGKADSKSAKQEQAAPVQRQQDPEAVIQTGPGVPTWTWKEWQLTWSGPVHRDHQVRLVMLSPPLGRALFLLRTLLSGLLALGLLRLALRSVPPPAQKAPPLAAAAALLFGLLSALAVLAWPETARAEIPSKETLDELRLRLSPPAECGTQCVSVSLLQVDANQTDMRLVLEAHAGDKGALQLPGPAQNWLPRVVNDNGARSQSLLLGADGFLYLRLLPGRHRIELIGPVGNDVTLMPGTPPHRVEVEARGWEVEGLSSNGQVEGPLTLRRTEAVAEAAEESGVEPAVVLPVWAALTRTLDFGVTWNVQTKLERIGPVGSPSTMRIPLLVGERVTTQGVTQLGQTAVVNLARDQAEFTFASTLTPSDTLKLTASQGANLSEHWVLRCSPIWHCETSGLAPTRHQSEGHYQPDFRPWPGEVLDVTLRRPMPEAGRHTTVDAAALVLSPGVRLLHAELTLSVRTSTQDSVSVTLPDNSELQELTVDGTPQPFGKGAATLDVSLVPGSHSVRLMWQQPGGMKSTFTAPPVKVKGEVVNARVTINVPDDRWLLFARGPSWGPAILFWGHLLMILLVAPILGRLSLGKLKTWQWAILALGLTQVPLFVAALIVAWFFVFGWAARSRPLRPLAHNFAQLGLALYTLVFLGCLFGAVYDGLLSTPDMEVVGAGSSNRSLNWYVDRTAGNLPTPVVFSTSLWAWRLVMLGWALWLSWNLIRWMRWGFDVFSSDGLWKKTPRRPLPEPGTPPFMPYPASPGPFPPTTAPRGQGAQPSSGFRPVPPPDRETQREAPHAEPPSRAPAARLQTPTRSEAPTHREGPQPITDAMVDEKTPIEPVVRMLEERRHTVSDETPTLEYSTATFATDSDPGDLASAPKVTDDPTRIDFEERPTLPRLDERTQEPFTFTAFDFRAAADALDRIDSTPAPATQDSTVAPIAEGATGETKDGKSNDSIPPSRLGTPPPKPQSLPPSAPPRAISHAPMATPPGGFTVEELGERKRDGKRDGNEEP